MDSDKLQNINEKQMIQFQELGIFEHASPIQHYRNSKLMGGGVVTFTFIISGITHQLAFNWLLMTADPPYTSQCTL